MRMQLQPAEDPNLAPQRLGKVRICTAAARCSLWCRSQSLGRLGGEPAPGAANSTDATGITAGKLRAGGEDGIRTHEALLGPTPLAGERLRPLGHLSGALVDKENAAANQSPQPNIADRTHMWRRRGAVAIPPRRFAGSSAKPFGTGRCGALPRSGWLMRTCRSWRKRGFSATWAVDSTPETRPPTLSLLNGQGPWVMSAPKKGRASASFSSTGDGAGNAVLRHKYPYPYLNF